MVYKHRSAASVIVSAHVYEDTLYQLYSRWWYHYRERKVCENYDLYLFVLTRHKISSDERGLDDLYYNDTHIQAIRNNV